MKCVRNSNTRQHAPSNSSHLTRAHPTSPRKGRKRGWGGWSGDNERTSIFAPRLDENHDPISTKFQRRTQGQGHHHGLAQTFWLTTIRPIFKLPAPRAPTGKEVIHFCNLFEENELKVSVNGYTKKKCFMIWAKTIMPSSWFSKILNPTGQDGK